MKKKKRTLPTPMSGVLKVVTIMEKRVPLPELFPYKGVTYLLEWNESHGVKSFEIVSLDRDSRREVGSGRIIGGFIYVQGQAWSTEVMALTDSGGDWTIYCSPATEQEIEENTFLKEHPNVRRVPVPKLDPADCVLPPEKSDPEPDSVKKDDRPSLVEMAALVKRFVIVAPNPAGSARTPKCVTESKPPFVPVVIAMVASYAENPRVFVAQKICEEYGVAFSDMRDPLKSSPDILLVRRIIAFVLKDKLKASYDDLQLIIGVSSRSRAETLYNAGRGIDFFDEDKVALAVMSRIDILIVQNT